MHLADREIGLKILTHEKLPEPSLKYVTKERTHLERQNIVDHLKNLLKYNEFSGVDEYDNTSL